MSARVVTQIVLGSIVVAVVGIVSLMDFRLRRHIRLSHPNVWRRFAFPSDSFRVAPKDERAHAVANIGFQEFFSQGHHRALEDSRVNALHRWVVLCRRVAFMAGALFLLSFVSF
jgi:hypothetical protein